VKLSWTPSTLFQQGPHIAISISATKFELAGRRLGFEFQELSVRALIDTGASVTVINPEIATNCKLRYTGRARIVAVGGEPGEYREHAAAISFPGTTLPGFDAIRVVACPIIRQPYFSCLIGRDILRNWLLTYDGRSGQVEIQA
jgi:predicted aspartyl protease